MMAISGLSRPPQHTLVQGRNGVGACTCASARIGEVVVAIINNATGANESTSFETTISVAGQIKQTSSSNLSSSEYWAITVG